MGRQKPNWVKKIANERIKRLFELAEKYGRSKPGLSKRYVTMAVNLSKKYNITIHKNLKKKYCKKCHAYLIAGYNTIIRKMPKKRILIYKCKECGYDNKRSA